MEMKTKGFNLTIHMVSSLDGYIARTDNSISWFETSCNYEKGIEGEDPEEFLRKIDCYVMGSKTYELAVELSKDYGWAYGDKPTFVLTTRHFHDDRKNISFHSGELVRFVNEKLKPNFENVWVVGGSALIKEIIRLKLANEIRVSILPIILGGGLPFFDQIGDEFLLNLKDTTAYKNGMVELCYEIRE